MNINPTKKTPTAVNESQEPKTRSAGAGINSTKNVSGKTVTI